VLAREGRRSPFTSKDKEKRESFRKSGRGGEEEKKG